jgi:hypothetical protein
LLFGTSGCHLCEKAEQATVRALASVPRIRWQTVEIADDERLIARYGTTIPVIRDEVSGVELCWPFGAPEIRSLLTAPNDSASDL